MPSTVCGGNQVRSTKTSVSCLHFFSVVPWKDIINLQKCEGCTHFCEILSIYGSNHATTAITTQSSQKHQTGCLFLCVCCTTSELLFWIHLKWKCASPTSTSCFFSRAGPDWEVPEVSHHRDDMIWGSLPQQQLSRETRCHTAQIMHFLHLQMTRKKKVRQVWPATRACWQQFGPFSGEGEDLLPILLR